MRFRWAKYKVIAPRAICNENMDLAISRHLPLITLRIEFVPQHISELPTITPRTDFSNLPDSRLIDTMDDVDLTVDSDAEMVDPLPIDSDPESEDCGVEDEKIPKPPGEAGRPMSGGYNLETALGWKCNTYNTILVSPYTIYHEFFL
jgi:hypothetical protein